MTNTAAKRSRPGRMDEAESLFILAELRRGAITPRLANLLFQWTPNEFESVTNL
ncbi:MAG: hypothetical protein JW749_02320 [Sedimentisphaerales bacterium]|nr:hypothetical protein [Sedimentisphaerales bacterium]